MLLTIEGVYSDRKVELTETPTGVEYTKVLVIFLPQAKPSRSARYLSYGQFAGENMSTEEDFVTAEWCGEMEGQEGKS